MFICCLIYNWSICTNATSTTARIQFANVKIFSWNCPLLRLWCKYSLVVCFNAYCNCILSNGNNIRIPEVGGYQFCLNIIQKVIILKYIFDIKNWLLKNYFNLNTIFRANQYFTKLRMYQAYPVWRIRQRWILYQCRHCCIQVTVQSSF